LSEDEVLIRAAREVRTKAYAPYSKFLVGAALRAIDGSVHAGCNVENSAYPTSMCAERGAISKAVAAGHVRFDAIAIACALDKQGQPGSPCGACRQALSEFGLGLKVILTGPGEGDPVVVLTLAELLPRAFTPENL
jgi:cytidine deaminase